MRALLVPEIDVLARSRKVKSRLKNLKVNSFISLLNEQEDLQEYSEVRHAVPLGGGAIALKDNIVTTTLPTTCGSGILRSFSSPYRSTVAEILNKHGGVIIGKTNLDEFGMGSYSINSYFGPVTGKTSPNRLLQVAGGSSGGSAVATGNHTAYVSLGTDTGGSVRLPAAYCSLVGFKPSYGLISRWGVVPYANSLDTVGILAREPWAAKKVFDILNRYDQKDPTSLSENSRTRLNERTNSRIKETKSLRIGVPVEYNIEELSQSVRHHWSMTIELLKTLGHSIHIVSLPSTQLALSAYYILAPAEASSNLAKYDGVRYGSRIDSTQLGTEHQSRDANNDDILDVGCGNALSVLFSKTRGAGFGDEVKRRILLGSYTLSAKAIDNYFVQAQKIRRLVQEDFNRVFALPNITAKDACSIGADNGIDIILCPTAPTEPPHLQDVNEQHPLNAYINDVFTVPASLAGLPAISVPITRWLTPDRNVVPIGMQFIAQYGDDQVVIALADQLYRHLIREPTSSNYFSFQRRRKLFEKFDKI